MISKGKNVPITLNQCQPATKPDKLSAPSFVPAWEPGHIPRILLSSVPWFSGIVGHSTPCVHGGPAKRPVDGARCPWCDAVGALRQTCASLWGDGTTGGGRGPAQRAPE